MQAIKRWIGVDDNVPYHQVLVLLSLHLIAFVLPFNGLLVSYSIVLFTLLLILSVALSSPIKVKFDWRVLLLPALFIIYLLSILYSADKQAGVRDLGTKFSLLLLPALFLIAGSFLQINIERVLLSFVCGCLLAGILCLCVAFVRVYNTGNVQLLVYEEFSTFMHPGYYSMQLDFAIAFIAWKMIRKEDPPLVSPMVSYSIIIFFIILLILLSTKLGVIVLFPLFVLYLFAFFSVNSRLKSRLWVSASLLIATTLIVLSIFKSPFSRFDSLKQVATYNQISASTDESTGLRVVIWKSTMRIIKDNWLMGVGAGDVEHVLVARYKELGIKKGVLMNLNAHNQYIQTIITTGIIGFLLMLYITIGMAIGAFLRKKYLFFIFLFIISANCAIECILQTQAGVIFFAFFFSLFLFGSLNQSVTLKRYLEPQTS